MSHKKKIKSHLRFSKDVYQAVLKRIEEDEWSNKELLEELKKVAFELNPATLSTYINHGGNVPNSLTDEDLLFLTGFLRINVKIVIEDEPMNEAQMKEYFRKTFPKNKFPNYENSADRIVKLYRSKNVII